MNEIEKKLTEHAGLAISIAKHYQYFNNYEDIVQCAHFGLYKAILRFKEEKSYKFSTFATKYIVGEIKEELRNNRLIRIPKYYFKILKFMNENQNCDLNEIINIFNIKYEQLISIININEVKYFNEYDKSDNYSIDNSLITNNLTNFEQKVINLKINCNMSQKQIAKELGISQSKVSRIIKQIILKQKENQH